MGNVNELTAVEARLKTARRNSEVRQGLERARHRQPEPDITELEIALEDGRDAGIPAEELKVCEELHARQKHREVCREQKRKVFARRPDPDLEELKELQKQAIEYELTLSELNEIQAQVLLAEKRLEARKQLKAAMERTPEPNETEL